MQFSSAKKLISTPKQPKQLAWKKMACCLENMENQMGATCMCVHHKLQGISLTQRVENCNLSKFPSCCEHVNMFCLFVTLEC